MDDFSRASLLAFQDYLAAKGLMNKNTVAAVKAAANNMLAVLDATEAEDLRQIDLDSVATRFANLKGKGYSPKSLATYRARTAKAIDDFLRYKSNPANFRVGARRPKSKTSGSDAASGERARETTNRMSEYTQMAAAAPRLHTLIVPIALRPSCIVQLNGIPVDLTKAEAQKISNVIMAMVVVSEE